MTIFSVSIHMVDRAYGGPEEGGWWFDYGEPDHAYFRKTKLFETKDEAYSYAKTLDHMIEELNKGRPSISSMASEGQYRVIVQEGYPHSWPEQRPHYE